MLKKENVALTKASAGEAFKCGECLHFKQTPHKAYPKVCSLQGVRQFALAPKCYTPDYTKIINNTDEFAAITLFFNSRTPQQKRILLGMLKQQPTGKRHRMGSKMFLNLRNKEYLSNYVCGYVVGYTSSGQIVLAGDPAGNSRGRVFFAYLQTDKSLLTDQEWATRRKTILNRGRLQDPDGVFVRDITKKVEEDTYEVPTIDSAPKEPKVKDNAIRRSTPLTKILEF